MIKSVKTLLDDVFVIQCKTFKDRRGTFTELFNKEDYGDIGIEKRIPPIEFLQDDVSVSSAHVLRGIHGDNETWKLVSCIRGYIYAVVVDCREEERTFGRWQAVLLIGPETGEMIQQLLIPPRFGFAHLVLSEHAILHYKQSTYYGQCQQFTYRWDDPRFGISWPISNPILSERDEKGEVR